MPAKKTRGPPKEMPKGPDPVHEAKLRQEAKRKELERQKLKQQTLQNSLNKVDTKLSNVKEDRTQAVEDTQEVLGDITREFKVQQNNYRQQIEAEQKYVAELEQKLADTQMKIRKTRDKFERQRHMKDEQIQKNITKSEQMAQEFRDMLKGTLVKMSDRIEMSRESDENQPNVDIGAPQLDKISMNSDQAPSETLAEHPEIESSI